jgi:GNAT superfamily N-acetyltransferase
VATLIREFAQYMLELGDARELKFNAEVLEREGFGPRPAFEGLVAEIGDEIEGFVLYHDGFDTDEACRVVFIVDLFVRQASRKLGIGAALMQEAGRIAKSQGARQLVWTVDKHNTAAVDFYERMNGRIADWLHIMYVDL